MSPGKGKTFNLSRLRTFSIRERKNLVTLKDLADPAKEPPQWDHPELNELVERIARAITSGNVVLISMGAHVIKAGLGPYIIEWMKRGWVSHVAGNGAVAIHDFELALAGGTSEDVGEGLERGTFGMWEETGRYMNQALVEGSERGMGFGASIGEFMDQKEELFPYREHSVIWWAWRLKIPATIHVTIGADIIHQHPRCDFAAIGKTSGEDFKLYCGTVACLEGGAFLNFGSAVTGPEVFLKAISMARNAGYKVSNITTANFDIVPLGDYRNAVIDKSVKPSYFYRPWKNIVCRPTSLGGKGFHIEGDHRNTIPVLHHRLNGLLSKGS